MVGVSIFHHPTEDLEDECAMCNRLARHKVGEEEASNTPDHDAFRMRHNFTNYLCCEHFGVVMGHVAREWCKGRFPSKGTPRGA